MTQRYFWRFSPSSGRSKGKAELGTVSVAEARILARRFGEKIELIHPKAMTEVCGRYRGRDREECIRDVVDRGWDYWPDGIVSPDDGAVSWF